MATAEQDLPQQISHQTDPAAPMVDDQIELERRYCTCVIRSYEHLGLDGLANSDDNLPLADLFIKLNLEGIQEGKSDEEGREGHPLARERDRRQERREEAIADALHNHRHLAVVGRPGSGKTTLVRWLALIFAQKRQAEADKLGANFTTSRLPIVVELRHFVKHFVEANRPPNTPSLTEVIAQYIGNKRRDCEGISVEFITDALRAGQCLLLLDGLDEITNSSVRSELVKAVSAFLGHSDYQQNLCILTMRSHGWQEMNVRRKMRRCEIKPFEPQDVAQFIRGWYATVYDATAQNEAQALIETIQANTRVTALATNPLLCTLIAIVYNRNTARGLPNRRVELYEECCQVLLERWEKNKDIQNEHDSLVIRQGNWKIWLELLAPLAYWMHESSQQRFSATLEQLTDQLAPILQSKYKIESESIAKVQADLFLKAITKRRDLLQSQGDGNLGFFHATFQEYLAAHHIASQPDPDYIDLVMAHLHEAWWREVHGLTIGVLGSGEKDQSEKASTLLRTILRVSRPPLRWLRACHRPLRPGLPGMLPRLYRSIARGLARVQWEQRLAWAMARELELAAIGYSDCAVEGLTTLARDTLLTQIATWFRRTVLDPGQLVPSFERYTFLTRPLIRVLPPEASRAMIEALFTLVRDDDANVRRAAAELVRDSPAENLRHLGQANRKAVEALLTALNDEDIFVRFSVAKSLRLMGKATPALTKVFLVALKEGDRPTKSSAAKSLEELAHTSPGVVVDELLATLKNDNASVDKIVIEILGKVGKVSSPVVEVLLAALKHEDQPMRVTAAKSLGQLKNPNQAIMEGLLAALKGDEDEVVRGTAAESLGQLQRTDLAVVDGLLAALEDADEFVRRAAARSLLELEQTNPAVQEAASDVLERERLSRPPRYISSQGASSQQFGSGEELLPLAIKDPSIREDLADTIEPLGPVSSAVLTELTAVLRNEEQSVRVFVAKRLGRLGHTSVEVIATLVVALKDKDKDVRQNAAASLGRLEQTNPEVIAALVAALRNDKDKDVRRRAVASLGQLREGSPAVRVAYMTALKDKDWCVRQGAAINLGQVKVEEETTLQRVLIALNRRLHDSNDDVRQAVLAAIHELLDGRPIPAYRWTPLRERQARQRRLRALSFWLGVAFLGTGVVLVAAWALTGVDADNFWLRALSILGVLIGVVSGVAQIVGRSLRPP